MGRVTVAGGKVGMAAPVLPLKGIALSTIAEGSVVKLNENGSPVEFYVAKHDYESGLNGAGRTLLVRKALFGLLVWESDNLNSSYETSDLSVWLNGTYKAKLDVAVQGAIATTTFRMGGSSTLARAVFQLSLKELGLTDAYATVMGSDLPIASTLAKASDYQWTRTRYTKNNYEVFALNKSGTVEHIYAYSQAYSRPCFTLPAMALFDVDTLEFKGVA